MSHYNINNDSNNNNSDDKQPQLLTNEVTFHREQLTTEDHSKEDPIVRSDIIRVFDNAHSKRKESTRDQNRVVDPTLPRGLEGTP